MPAVVFDLAAAMPTGQDRRADAKKRLWLSFAEIKQTVMARVKAAGYRQARADFDGNPVPEIKTLLVEESAEQHVPFRKVV